MRALKFLFSFALVCALALAASAQDKKSSSEPETRQKLKIEPDQRYLMLATQKTSTMQKELDEAASRGFRVITGSPTSTMEMAVLLERVADPASAYQYRLLATTKIATMRKELNESAQEGYRLLPRTMTSKEGFLSLEIVMLMEKAPNTDKRYEYRLYATLSEKKMRAEIEKSEAEGFTLAGMVSRGQHMVIMEREYRQDQKPSDIP
jgi:hypothetical protein